MFSRRGGKWKSSREEWRSNFLDETRRYLVECAVETDAKGRLEFSLFERETNRSFHRHTAFLSPSPRPILVFFPLVHAQRRLNFPPFPVQSSRLLAASDTPHYERFHGR